MSKKRKKKKGSGQRKRRLRFTGVPAVRELKALIYSILLRRQGR